MLSGIQYFMFCPRQWGLIHLTRVRGLKLRPTSVRWCVHSQSHPMRVRGLKRFLHEFFRRDLGSHPMRVRGLKQDDGARKGSRIGYPSRRSHPARTLCRSAERKQDWVPVPPGSPGSHLRQECGKETRLGIRTAGVTRLAPHTGVRKGDKIGYPSRRGHPARTSRRSAERRQDWIPVPPGSPGSHLTQECGKETRLGTRPAGVTRLLCRQKSINEGIIRRMLF